ncbi:glycosyltransferase family 4 protein [Archaeoglobus neptunius]|uniref:glycosyltransferase family 4 protein n=1 Tax=Archaeoglobus neptunius TaxID=2798580 RepID=UPI001925BD32|nr:glycosyltransferase family 4 protein [Archaeoglobus neptunius]
MDILWFNWRDIRNPEAGGAEVYTHEIAKRLAKKGHSITLFTSKFRNCEKEEVIDGIRVVREGGKYTVYQKAKRFYKRNCSKFDVVIDEINTKPFHTPKFVDKGKIVALIHQLAREFWFYETPFPLDLIGYYLLEKRWLKNYVDLPTITVSNSTKEDLESLGFRKTYIVHNGLNVNLVNKDSEKADKPVVIFVGRMKKAKKPQDAIKAFEIVKREIKDAELWMVGDGYLRKKLKSKAEKGVRFFGYVDWKIKDELVKKAWVIAVPGVREGWGQVVTDANALGTPAVGYNVPGLRDSIRDGYNGLLVDTHPEALADAIIRILTDNKLREKLSRNAIEWAKQFSWDRSAEEFERVIEEVVQQS